MVIEPRPEEAAGWRRLLARALLPLPPVMCDVERPIEVVVACLLRHAGDVLYGGAAKHACQHVVHPKVRLDVVVGDVRANRHRVHCCTLTDRILAVLDGMGWESMGWGKVSGIGWG